MYGSSGVGIDCGAHTCLADSAQRLSASDVKLDLSGAYVEHHANLEGAHVRDIDGHGLELKGDLRLDTFVRGEETISTEIGKLDLELAHIHGDLRLVGVQVTQTLKLRCARIGGDLLAVAMVTRSDERAVRTEFTKTADLSRHLKYVISDWWGVRATSLSLVAAAIRGDDVRRGALQEKKSQPTPRQPDRAKSARHRDRDL